MDITTAVIDETRARELADLREKAMPHVIALAQLAVDAKVNTGTCLAGRGNDCEGCPMMIIIDDESETDVCDVLISCMQVVRNLEMEKAKETSKE